MPHVPEKMVNHPHGHGWTSYDQSQCELCARHNMATVFWAIGRHHALGMFHQPHAYLPREVAFPFDTVDGTVGCMSGKA